MTNWERFLRDPQIDLKGMKTEEAKNFIDCLIAHILNSVGDNAQLANVDLQNILQKQQQAIQMMSNMSKLMQDTAMSVIRKIGG